MYDYKRIKKALYKSKPVATLYRKDKDYFYYQVIIWNTYMNCEHGVLFKVPIEDMGETLFGDEEPAQLLIRYINE